MHTWIRNAAKFGRSFNPRPTVRSGDAQRCVRQGGWLMRFQSAPDREVGRCDTQLMAWQMH